jgi:alpha-L-fucosidase 2
MLTRVPPLPFRRLAALGLPALALVISGAPSLGATASSAPVVPAGATFVATTAADDHRGLTLWYDEPATDWETQSLPIGNGAMGASVFGGVQGELLQFNEKTLWTGGPGSRDGYDFGNWRSPRPGALEEVQDRIDRELRVDPNWVASKLGQSKRGYGG